MEKLKITAKQTTGSAYSRKRTRTGSTAKTCPKHGKYDAYFKSAFTGNIIEISCPRCVEEQREKDKQEKQRNYVNAMYTQSGIPTRYKNKTLKDYKARTEEESKAFKKITKYLDEFQDLYKKGASAFLCGTPGTGKTLIGCILVHGVISTGISANYITAWNMIQEIRHGYSSKESVTQYIRDYIKPGLLVIDEIGVQSGSNDERVLLYQVIDGRYNEVKPTVLISNSKNPVADGYLDLRIIDRLKDGGGFSIVFQGKSNRK